MPAERLGIPLYPGYSKACEFGNGAYPLHLRVTDCLVGVRAMASKHFTKNIVCLIQNWLVLPSDK